MYEATDAGTAADHEPAMGQSSSSADGTSISQDQSVNNNVAALQPAAMQEVCIKTYCRASCCMAVFLLGVSRLDDNLSPLALWNGDASCTAFKASDAPYSTSAFLSHTCMMVQGIVVASPADFRCLLLDDASTSGI